LPSGFPKIQTEKRQTDDAFRFGTFCGKIKEMKLLFSIEDQVHHFRVIGEIESQDLIVLREGLFRFFESNPTYTVLDLSDAKVNVPNSDLQNILYEIKSLISSKNLNLIIAETAIQARQARQKVLELALTRQLEMLQAKLELREKIRGDAEFLIAENEKLKESVAGQVEKLKNLQPDAAPTILSPLFEKLWSEK
jgi:hypothetical protein